MMIAKAIRTSQSEAAVRFLLTAYLENLSRFEPPSRLPEPVLRLPLTGYEDVRDRMLALIKELLAPRESVDETDSDVLIDALRVFGATVYRLTMLQPREESCHDSRHSTRAQHVGSFEDPLTQQEEQVKALDFDCTSSR
jgi:hypothetical protein